jgi:hypothetical protein
MPLNGREETMQFNSNLKTQPLPANGTNRIVASKPQITSQQRQFALQSVRDGAGVQTPARHASRLQNEVPRSDQVDGPETVVKQQVIPAREFDARVPLGPGQARLQTSHALYDPAKALKIPVKNTLPLGRSVTPGLKHQTSQKTSGSTHDAEIAFGNDTRVKHTLGTRGDRFGQTHVSQPTVSTPDTTDMEQSRQQSMDSNASHDSTMFDAARAGDYGEGQYNDEIDEKTAIYRGNGFVKRKQPLREADLHVLIWRTSCRGQARRQGKFWYKTRIIWTGSRHRSARCTATPVHR